MGPVSSKNNSSGQLAAKYREEGSKKPRVRTIKLLLYGPGESGKTTILRQMRLIHGESLMDERRQRKGLICLNVIEGAAFTVRAARIKFGIEFKDPIAAKAAETVIDAHDTFSKASKSGATNLNSPSLVSALTYLADDPDFQSALARRNEYQIHDGWFYYAQRLKEWPTWGGPDWIPSANDLLHSRIMTTGKNSFDFNLDGVEYQLIDVGGQQSERRKFFNIFSQMDCVLFVASLSEYNQVLFEDETTNRLTETVRVWRSTVNHPEFARTWFLLFLNKVDIFQEKFYDNKRPIELFFKYKPDAPKPEDEVNRKCEKALKWFDDLYMNQVAPNKKNQVRLFITNAMEPDNISNAMNRCTTFLMGQDDIGTWSS